MSRKDALTAFRQFRDRLRKAAGADLALDVDSGTRTDPAHRWCWFTGKDAAASAATQAVAAEVRAWEVSDAARIANAAVPLVEAETRSVVRKPQDAVAVRVEAIGKPVVRCFVSYAHADAKFKDDLLKRLREQLGYDRHLRFEFWDDGGISAGSRWSASIQSNIESCDFGLLLISPAFLGSAFITQQELPVLCRQRGAIGKALRAGRAQVIQNSMAMPICMASNITRSSFTPPIGHSSNASATARGMTSPRHWVSESSKLCAKQDRARRRRRRYGKTCWKNGRAKA